jgi:hypothetical protein
MAVFSWRLLAAASLALSLKESETYAALARIRSSGQHDTNI